MTSVLKPYIKDIPRVDDRCVVNEISGANVKVEIVYDWEGSGQKVAVRTNHPNKWRKIITLHEAAILACLNGEAGAPRLIYTDPDRGVIVMEYLGKNTLADIIREMKSHDEFGLLILYGCA